MVMAHEYGVYELELREGQLLGSFAWCRSQMDMVYVGCNMAQGYVSLLQNTGMEKVKAYYKTNAFLSQYQVLPGRFIG